MAGVIFDGKLVAPAVVVDKPVLTDEWMPPSEWADIQKIVDGITDYQYKIGILYYATLPKWTDNGFGTNVATKAYLSDGQEISYLKYNTEITWDESKDIQISDGSKMRWVVFCFDTMPTVDATEYIGVYSDKSNDPAVYAYISGDIDASGKYVALSGAFKGQKWLRYVKIKNSLILGNNSNHFDGCSSLEQIPKNVKYVSSTASANNIAPYKGCASLKEVDFEDVFPFSITPTQAGWASIRVLPKVYVNKIPPADMSYAMSSSEIPYTYLVTIPDGWDLSQCTTVNRAFASLTSLIYAGDFNISSNTATFTSSRTPFAGSKYLKEIRYTLPSNTDVWFNVSTVVSIESFRFIADHAPDVTAKPRTLTIGSTNISRINAADPTIITDLNAKGWTVA